MKNFKINLAPVLFLSLLLCFTACEDDTEDVMTTIVEAEDFTITIDEDVNVGQYLGQIQGSTNNGTVTYEISSESPEGAFNLDAETGDLRVLDALLFDYEENQTITAVVKVANGGVSANSNVTVHLNDVVEEPLTAEDFYTEMQEDPENNKIIGTIEATAAEGELSFELLSQSNEGAFSLDTSSGVLRVADRTIFDFEVNPTLTGEARVSNGDISIDVTITIDLLDTGDCAESQDDFAFFIYDLLNNFDFLQDYAMETEVHEYTFSLEQPATLCSVGYQAYNPEQSYLIEVIDGEGIVVFAEEMLFSFTSQDNVAIEPVNLSAGQSYTIRRTTEAVESTEELRGYIIFESEEGTTFPIQHNNFTIESANFYDDGGSFPNVAFPRISLGFN